VHVETLKIWGVAPFTLTVIDSVPDEIVCGLRTVALTIRVALDVVVVDDEPVPGIIRVN
jgi:hypothetical protein